MSSPAQAMENFGAAAAQASRPRPYRVDAPVHKVQSLEYDGDDPYIFRHDFTRLDASNFQLLLDKEKATDRITEKMTKGRSRAHEPDLTPEADFYSALITGGGWKPGNLPTGLPEKPGTFDGECYVQDEESGLWEPTGWHEFTREEALRFLPERKKNGNVAYLRAKGEFIPIRKGIDFMFEQAGTMRVRLLIGDPSEPAYRLLLELRRPDSKRRNRFRDDFIYGVDHSKGDLGKVETIIDYRQGVGVFDEFFGGIVDDPEHSLVVMEQRPITTGDMAQDEQHESIQPYHEGMKSAFIGFFNPLFKMEAATTMITSFGKTDRD